MEGATGERGPSARNFWESVCWQTEHYPCFWKFQALQEREAGGGYACYDVLTFIILPMVALYGFLRGFSMCTGVYVASI